MIPDLVLHTPLLCGIEWRISQKGGQRNLFVSLHICMTQENTPVIPLPNPGEGGPLPNGTPTGTTLPATPTVPAQPVIPAIPMEPAKPSTPSWPALPPKPRYGSVRFLNAAIDYSAFRIFVDNTRRVSFLNYTSLSSYHPISAGYHTITVAGPDGYIYLQKSLPFRADTSTTVAVINRAGGLDLLAIPDFCCSPGREYSNLRVCNLAYNSKPLDVLLADGRTIYADVRFRETTSEKRIHPGAYEFLFADTNQLPMPAKTDIETMDSAFLGVHPTQDILISLYLNIRRATNNTLFILSGGTSADALQVMVVDDH